MFSLVEMAVLIALAALAAGGLALGCEVAQQRQWGRGPARTATGDVVHSPRTVQRQVRFLRSVPRYRVPCDIGYTGLGYVGMGRVLDMSREGWRVRGNCPVLSGEALRLQMFLPGCATPVEVERAVVRWTNGQEFGIELEMMQPEPAARLSEFLSTLPCLAASAPPSVQEAALQ